jgi:hypothetical protein
MTDKPCNRILTPKESADRNAILGLNLKLNWVGGIYPLANLSIITLRQLVASGFLDPDDTQNCAPSAGEMIEFMEAHPGMTAHGYVVEASRNDSRIALEGIACPEHLVTSEMREAFIEFARHADEFEHRNDLRAWWTSHVTYRCTPHHAAPGQPIPGENSLNPRPESRIELQRKDLRRSPLETEPSMPAPLSPQWTSSCASPSREE